MTKLNILTFVFILLIITLTLPLIKKIIIKSQAEKIKKIIANYKDIDNRYKYYITEITKKNKTDLEDDIKEINDIIDYAGGWDEFLEKREQKQTEYEQCILLYEEYLKSRKDYNDMIEEIKEVYKI